MTQGIKGPGSGFSPSTIYQDTLHHRAKQRQAPSNGADEFQGEEARFAPTTPARMVPVIDKSKVDPKLLEAAEGMEAMFLDYMMKVMRETVPKNEMDLENPASQIYRGMQDSEFAQKAARHGGVGLADQVIAYLGSPGYPEIKGTGTPTKEKP